MTENQVNEAVRKWLLANNYKYKGVLNTKNGTSETTEATAEDIAMGRTSFGQVLVPAPTSREDDRTRLGAVLLDHQGVKDREHEIIWVEAKGGGVGMSQLLEGFIRLTYGCYWGGGSGLLAIPHTESEVMLEQRDFLKKVSVSCERRLGILDAEKQEVYWF